MEGSLRQLYQDRAGLEDTLAIMLIEKEISPLSITDGSEVVILLIHNQPEEEWQVKHYEVEGKQVSFHFLSQSMMHQILIAGNQRRFIDWLVNGKIVFDRNEFLKGIKDRIESFPPDDRSKKMTIQFTKLLRRFEEGRTLFRHQHYFDAYSHMMHALHHLARLSVIHHGYYPEVTVWEQVRHIEPQTYKLYQELLKSEEPLEKRIELLILATEFAVHSKTSVGSQHFLSIIEEGPSTMADYMEHPEVEDYRVDLELLVQHLVEKGFLSTEKERTKAEGITKLTYFLKKRC